MKTKMIFLSILAIITTLSGYSQKVTKTGSNSSVFTSKDSAMCKQWVLVSIEEFGVVNPPTEQQKKDGITFTNDGTVFLTREGKAQTGTWTLDKARTYILLNFEEPKEKLRFKLMKVDDRQLKYEYQEPNLIRLIYTYEEKK